MKERLIRTGRHWQERNANGEYWQVLSADMRDVIAEVRTFELAQQTLERQIKLERMQCASGKCED